MVRTQSHDQEPEVANQGAMRSGRGGEYVSIADVKQVKKKMAAEAAAHM